MTDALTALVITGTRTLLDAAGSWPPWRRFWNGRVLEPTLSSVSGCSEPPPKSQHCSRPTGYRPIHQRLVRTGTLIKYVPTWAGFIWFLHPQRSIPSMTSVSLCIRVCSNDHAIHLHLPFNPWHGDSDDTSNFFGPLGFWRCGHHRRHRTQLLVPARASFNATSLLLLLWSAF